MEISCWKGYIAAFLFLDAYWEKNKNEMDDLALVVSSMDPYIWGGNLPIDKVMFTQWIDIYKDGDVMREEVNEEQCFEFMIKYLYQQEKNFGADLKLLINKLEKTLNDRNNQKELWTWWIDSCLNAINSVE